MRANSSELITNNETFHRLLKEEVKVSYQKNGKDRGDLVQLVDFKIIKNNDFFVANQFTIIEDNQNKRPDVILFINGIPLVVMELKNTVGDTASISHFLLINGIYQSV